jgi:predicted RNA-binding Zn ribbon-like protein
MPDSTTPSPGFVFVGNHRSLDFINTLISGPEGPIELLKSPETMAKWCEQARIFRSGEHAAFAAHMKQSSAGALLAHAIRFRADLEEILRCGSTSQPAAAKAAKLINAVLARAPQLLTATVRQKRLSPQLTSDQQSSSFDRFLSELAKDALDLFTKIDLRQVKRCANPDCVLYFHDDSKNHTRQWCSMRICGNRAKASRFRKRHVRIGHVVRHVRVSR